MNLEGRHVVITGASGGLGGAVLDALLTSGATCHVPERSATAGPAARARLEVVRGVDLTAEAAVTGFYASRPPLWASVHLAGGFAAGPALETSLADLRRQLDLNLVTSFLCCREALRNFQRAKGGGRLVNVSSRAANLPGAGVLAYGISKAGVNMLTQALAEETKGSGVQVNAVAPSIIDTPANRAAMPKAPHERWPKPAAIAQAVLWLVSPENTLTSGAIVPVYGES